MFNQTMSSIRVLSWMLWRDLYVLRKHIGGKIIDSLVWGTNIILISAFVLPAFGTSNVFGLIIWIGTITSMAVYEAVYEAQDMVADREGNFHTGYLLTLPIPSWLVFIKMALSVAINTTVLSFFMFPLGRIILRNRVSLIYFSLTKFLLFFLVLNLFCGFFAIWIYSWAKNPTRFSVVRRRVVNPLWAFGGAQFTWYILYETFPRLALIALLNPLTYAFDGLRASVLGPEGYIPFWVSFTMVIFFAILFGWWGIAWLRKRLDFV